MISLLVLCLSSALLVNSIPIQQEIQSRDNYDAILNLLPLYGNTKLEKVINKKSLDSVKGYFDKNPKNYETLRTALATEGVFMPPLNELKLEVITTEDYNILKGLIGSYTLRDALNAQTVNKIINDIKNDQVLMDRLFLRFDEANIKFGTTVDLAAVGATLYDAFEPMVPSFMFTGINIILFG